MDVQRYLWKAPSDKAPRKFKGSVFVEWSTEEEAKAALATELKYKEVALVLKAK
eukprot:SAG31_NODE_32896_length_350_cov_1.027888_1_plen_53_part_10